MALTNMRFKDQIGLNLGEETVEKKRKREGEKKKKRKRKEGDQASQDQEVWNYMGFKALNGFPCNCIVISCLQT